MSADIRGFTLWTLVTVHLPPELLGLSQVKELLISQSQSESARLCFTSHACYSSITFISIIQIVMIWEGAPQAIHYWWIIIWQFSDNNTRVLSLAVVKVE